MPDPRKFYRPPSNVAYQIDGCSYGLDDDLVEAIRNSIRRRLESRTLDIPRLPQVASRILELSKKPSTSLDDIAQTIIADPQLATRILTIANSAAYASGSRIEGLPQALMRLGSKLVMDTVFAESIRMKIFSARAYRATLEQSWRLSLGTAVACEALSKETGIERDRAFLLGLLHDTGTPVLVNAVAEHERQNGGRALGEEVVEIILSQLHEETGAHVLTEWGMSPAIVEAAREHHRYRGAGRDTPASSLVHAGNLVCRHLGIGAARKEVIFTVEHVFADLGLSDHDTIMGLVETISVEIEGLLQGLRSS